jgi:hypothetical protein
VRSGAKKNKNLSALFEAFQFGYQFVRGVKLPKCLLVVNLLVSSRKRTLLVVDRALLSVKRGLVLKQKSPTKCQKRSNRTGKNKTSRCSGRSGGESCKNASEHAIFFILQE